MKSKTSATILVATVFTCAPKHNVLSLVMKVNPV